MPTLCDICNNQPSKYKCPTCEAPYCSIACFKAHKETHNVTTRPTPQDTTTESDAPSTAVHNISTLTVQPQALEIPPPTTTTTAAIIPQTTTQPPHPSAQSQSQSQSQSQPQPQHQPFDPKSQLLQTLLTQHPTLLPILQRINKAATQPPSLPTPSSNDSSSQPHFPSYDTSSRYPGRGRGRGRGRASRGRGRGSSQHQHEYQHQQAQYWTPQKGEKTALGLIKKLRDTQSVEGDAMRSFVDFALGSGGRGDDDGDDGVNGVEGK